MRYMSMISALRGVRTPRDGATAASSRGGPEGAPPPLSREPPRAARPALSRVSAMALTASGAPTLGTKRRYGHRNSSSVFRWLLYASH